tara:strand:+ start:987 stop:1220 length:234 start_codon:yes stop_codon:yes gene_type:complete
MPNNNETLMLPVDSSMIEAIGYDAETSTLLVDFVKGGTYSYADVPESVYADLISAESVGKAFHATVKHAGFTFTREA